MAPTFTKITPSLPVTSVPESLEYYTGVLGFRVAGRDGDDHCWLQLASSDGEEKQSTAVNLYLRRRTFPNLPNDVAFGKVHIRIAGADDELEKLFKQLTSNGAKVEQEVTHKPWGLKSFTLTDLDENIINFDQVIAGWKPPTGTA